MHQNFRLPKPQHVLIASATALLAACSSSDDDNPTPPATPASLSAGMDRGQATNSPTLGTNVRVTVRNLAPNLGTFQTPVWFAVHDGNFDIYDSGAAASAELESLAEDGDFSGLGAAFGASGAGSISGAVTGSLAAPGPISPGESASTVFRLDPSLTPPLFFSYASMIIPSNDAFLANGDPLAFQLVDAGGTFSPLSITRVAADALDAGTEVNDELPANTAFFGQATPNTGTAEGGVIGAHPGFLAAGMGGILDDAMFAGADFANVAGYEFLQIDVTEEAVSNEPTGLASFELNAARTMLTYAVAASDLSGDVTAMHLHDGAAGVAGGVILDLASGITMNANGVMRAAGVLPVTTAQAAMMESGDTYVNIHTALNPGGEIRGQVAVGEVFNAAIDTTEQVTPPVLGTDISVTVQNRAPNLGTFQTPLWIGFHDGTFDIYDSGVAASLSLESLAEDGDASSLGADFAAAMGSNLASSIAGTQTPGPIAPGEQASVTLRLNPDDATNGYFSWASMILPSNDAFVANGDPLAHSIFDGAGMFVGTDFTVAAAGALDAGTEVNDELPGNTAFFGQATPNTGTTEGGVIGAHPGFLAAGMGGILDDAMFTNADFANTAGYEFMRVYLREGAAPTAGTGTMSLVLADDGVTATLNVNVIDLSGPATAMHLHNAPAGSDGPVEVDLMSLITRNSDGALIATGSVVLTSAQATALRAGNLYINVHTALNPAGEIRGQIQ